MNRVREALPSIQATLPSKLDLRFLFDQSLFVRAAVDGVIKEAAIAACLTALMILLFLGSWRSTLIVAISMPLSILWTIMVMRVAGQTLNVMTLGGLALAVGILVDDAMVEIENIHRHPAQGKPIIHAIVDGAQQIATPAFVSTLSICIVFGPVVFLTGAVQSLFTPLAMAVVVAMMASYLLSRTLILTLIRYLLHSEVQMYQHGNGDHGAAAHRLIWNMHHRFNRRIERFRGRYRNVLAWSLHHRAAVKGLAATFFAGSLVLVLLSGKIFFPPDHHHGIARCAGGDSLDVVRDPNYPECSGDIQAIEDTPIYARANGYLRRRWQQSISCSACYTKATSTHSPSCLRCPRRAWEPSWHYAYAIRT